MKKNKNEEIILTKKKASEIFYVLSVARYRLTGKVKTLAGNYWEEFENVLGLNPYKEFKKTEKQCKQ